MTLKPFFLLDTPSHAEHHHAKFGSTQQSGSEDKAGHTNWLRDGHGVSSTPPNFVMGGGGIKRQINSWFPFNCNN